MNIPTFILNLPERQDRLENAVSQLERFGMDYGVWIATKRENGKLGLIITMKEIFEYALSEDVDSLFILEDDMKIVTDDFVQLINKCIKQLPKDFDLFYAGCNLHGNCKKYSDNLLSATGMYATHAVIYSKAAIRKILPLLEYADTYDTMLVSKIQPDGKCYCSYPLLISQTNGYSDIEGREVDYTKFIEKRFSEKTKGI